MKSLWSVAIKFIKSNKIIFFSCLMCVALTIGLITSMSALGTQAETNFKAEVKAIYGDFDLMVGYQPGSNIKIAQSVIDKISAIDDIKMHSDVFMENCGITGGASSRLHDIKVTAIGIENDEFSLSRYKIINGIHNGEVVLTESLAQALNVKVNDKVIIGFTANTKEACKVIQVIKDVSADVTHDAMYLNREWLIKQVGSTKSATCTFIKLKPNKDVYKVADRIKKIDNKLQFQIAEGDENIQSNLKNIKYYFGIMSIMALIMSSLIMISNMNIFIYRYRSNIAIIRSLGGSPWQTIKLIMYQSAVIVGIGAIIGELLAYFICGSFSSRVMNYFHVKNMVNKFPFFQTSLIAIFGAISIMGFMLVPAIKTSRILPNEILHNNEKLDLDKSKLKQKSHRVVLLVAIALLIIGLTRKDVQGGFFSGIAFIVYLFIMSTYFIKHIFSLLKHIAYKCKANLLGMAISNMMPQVKRNLLLLLSIATAVIVLVLGNSIFSTMKHTTEDYLKKEYASDIVVSSRYGYDTNLSYRQKSEFSKIDGIKNVVVNSWFVGRQASNKKIDLDYCLTDFSELEKMHLIPKIEGGYQNKLLISRKYAEKEKLNVGDRINFKGYDVYSKGTMFHADAVEVTVAAIVKEIPLINYDCAIADWSTVGLNDETLNMDKVLITIDKSKNTQVQAGLEKLKGKYPELKWTTLKQMLAEFDRDFNQRFIMFHVVAAIILVMVIIGLSNTLNNYINHRRREYALLRALSLTRCKLFFMILLQTIVYIILGLILGFISSGILITTISFTGDAITISMSIVCEEIFAILICCILMILPISISISRGAINKELKHVE